MSNVNSKEAKEAKYENKTMSNGKINKKYVFHARIMKNNNLL